MNSSVVTEPRRNRITPACGCSTNNQFTEITIVGDDDALFTYGYGQNVNVFECGRVILADSRNVVTQLPEIGASDNSYSRRGESVDSPGHAFRI